MIEKDDKVMKKGETEVFTVLGVRGELAFVTNDRIMNDPTPNSGIYIKLEELEKQE